MPHGGVERAVDATCDAAVGSAAPVGGAVASAPRAMPIGVDGPPVLALGAWFKNAACVVHEGVARFGAPIGDLDDADACRRLEHDVERLLAIPARPLAAVAHDLHPDFHSTRVAVALAARLGVPVIAVQHHHAHVAAVLAEHRHRGAAIGLALDGVGLGSDGTAWGGELLHVDGARFVRLGHLAPLPLPGGDRAAREPWRMAAAVLARIGRGGEIATRFAAQRAARLLPAVLERDVLCPPTSSLGRVFDAAAGLLGVCEVMTYEAEAAIALERLAAAYHAAHGVPAAEADAWRIDDHGRLDLVPLLARLADEHDAGRGAARFHATLAAALDDWVARVVGGAVADAPAQVCPGPATAGACEQARPAGADAPVPVRAAAAAARALTPPDADATDAAAERAQAHPAAGVVALGGGCFHNRILAVALGGRLRARGLAVLEAQRLSPGDAALALGQAWVALHHLNGGH
jgi:hydrogenase maturation protein HypF